MAFPTTNLLARYEALSETAYSDGNEATTVTNQVSSSISNGEGRGLTWRSNVLNGHAVYRFDGTDDYANASISLVTYTAWSISAVVKAASEGTSRSWPFVMGEETTDIMAFTEGATSSEWGAFARTSGSGSGTNQIFTSGVDTTEWTHLLLVWDGSTVTFYRDGSVVNSGSRAGGFDADSLSMGDLDYRGKGGVANLGEYFGGDIALMAAWSKALDSTERGDLQDYVDSTYFAAAGAPEASGTVSAEASLSATGHVAKEASGTTTAEGSLTAEGHRVSEASGSVSAEGSLSATGEALAVAAEASGTVSAEASLTAEGARDSKASGTISVEGSLTAEGHRDSSVAGSVSAEGSLSATGHVSPQTSGTVSAEGSLSATGHIDAEASGRVAAEGSLTATGQAVEAASASGTVTAEGSLSATGYIEPAASGTVTGLGSLSATGETPQAAPIPRASGTVSAEGSLSGGGYATPKAFSTVAAVGHLEGVGYLAPFSSGVVEAIASLNGVGRSDVPPFWTPDPVDHTSDPVDHTSDPVGYKPARRHEPAPW
jgi:hypothetical protein